MSFLDDYQKVTKQAQKILDHKEDWVILDTETTGLYRAEIIQLGVIDLDRKFLLDTLVKPTISIPSDASSIHGITDNQVVNAPSFPQIYPKLSEVLHDKKVLIYNASFDLGILDYCCSLHQLPDLNIDYCTCLMLMYAVFCGNWSDYHGSYTWQPLPVGDHSAIGDCLSALKVLEKMASKAGKSPF